jgi:hypothetical protein
LNCLYCGKEIWLPGRVRRDPDFCSPDHREKYNSRVDLAMQRLQESSASPASQPVPAPVMEIPAAQTPRSEAGSAPSSNVYEESPARSPLSGGFLQLNIPRMAVRPLFDRLEEQEQSTQQRDQEAPAFTHIFSLPDAAAISRRKVGRHVLTAIAALVSAAAALWIGGDAGKLGTDLLSEGAAAVGASSNTASLAMASPLAPRARPEPGSFRHPVDWVLSAAARHAAIQLAESFGDGMAAWGIGSNGWAPGWARSPDGYVRPGQLALFQPTLAYADYRLDFFGEIEKNSMSWVVRGKDAQNYYAMKVNLLRPGLRPVLSMVHYPVVQGRQGHKVELPLSVMIHNGMPYHVSVEVKGSHYTASIEGEEVDSWSDDTLLAGGVGFFSETGERARIYWMKVSQNDDWLGRLCGHIAASGGARDSAWLKRPAPLLLPAPAMAVLWP